ncbi:ATP-binding protein [Marinovum sp. 2_MG-2023]|uniref:sensor histidine kinase n=1 Tax=unclassified Marinovum TaxID=2647166 RepID=UPI0026E45602|nr:MULTISPECIES: ATP-binding protein [unclassified Marinovum]MDO6732247.1 ATP-binding protein [Marinovum sp. 2_MG-2023]MDO6781533.1 ATP-binding protein [Marinovum sp. 1_MG-2023]
MPYSAEMLQSVIDALPQALVAIGADERIRHTNEPALKLVGLNPEGKHFITTLRQPALLDTIEATLGDRKTRETSFLTREDGQDVTYNVRCASIQIGPEFGVLLSFEDVTHLAVAGQMRRDFVANVSHELKTPLTALLGFIETILHGPAHDDAVARDRFLAIMESEAERMNRLVGDLLSLNRVEATERMRPTTRIDLKALVQSALGGLAGMADDVGLEVVTDLPDDPVFVAADEDQLRQVLNNLIENAIKYGAEGKHIEVSLTSPAFHPRMRCDTVELVVRDHGAGFDPVHIPRLTERFYRVDNHRSREMGGTGLGLAIVKHIVGRHRGRIQIESALGQGSTFRVLLPV